MIEQAIFAAVGFLTATLLALAAAPAVAGRARRLAETRARLLAPLSEAQAIADRDALRAQHALETVRLERRLRAADETAAARKIEAGRLKTKLLALEEATATGVADLEAARRDANELRGALGASQIALADLDRQRHNVERALDDSETVVEERRAEIAALQTRIAALELRVADVETAAAAAAERAAGERDSALANAASAARADGDKALRAAIARLGRDVARIEGRRRIAEAEPINLAAPLHPAPAGKIRQSEPAAREG